MYISGMKILCTKVAQPRSPWENVYDLQFKMVNIKPKVSFTKRHKMLI